MQQVETFTARVCDKAHAHWGHQLKTTGSAFFFFFFPSFFALCRLWKYIVFFVYFVLFIVAFLSMHFTLLLCI